MAVFKRGGVWWYEFIYAGERIRASAKTGRKTIAIEAEKDHRRRLERSFAGLPSEAAPEKRVRAVSVAFREYQKQYEVNHAEKSVLLVKERGRHIERLLGSVMIGDLTQEKMIGYMGRRKSEKASGRTVNIEVAVLARALDSTWKTLWPKLRRLPENQDTGVALEPEQEHLILEAAARNLSKLIYPFLMTSVWTGLRSDEVRRLRWRQIDFEAEEVVVGKSKSEAGRGRVIPLSAALRAALEAHAGWYARAFGPLQPEWYVFPFCRTRRPVDPNRPIRSIKKSWESVRRAAGVKCRLHDMRHSFCTKLGEAGVPESVMLDMMGHVSRKMLQRYSHIRAQARREAIRALENRISSGVPTKVPTVAAAPVAGRP